MSRLATSAVALLTLLAVACGNGGAASPATTTTTMVAGLGTTPPEATSTTAAAPPATWQPRGSAPTPRQEVASAVLDGRVWVIGGLTAAGATAVVESYDPVTDRWAAGPALPVAVHHAAATVYQGEIVVAGGFSAGASLYAQPSERVLALRAGRWIDLPPLRRPRGAAAAAVAGGMLVVAGGRDSTALIGPTEIYDGAAWRDGSPMPTRRDHLSAVSDGRSLFTVGGRFLTPGATSAAFERYDPATDGWERLPAMPTARGGQGAALAAGRVIVAGGEDPTGVHAEVEAYDISTQTWTALPSLPTPRHGLAVERVGDQVVALVGGTAFGVAPSTRAEALARFS